MRKTFVSAIAGLSAYAGASCVPPTPEAYPVVERHNIPNTELVWQEFPDQPQESQISTFVPDDNDPDKDPLIIAIPGGDYNGALCDPPSDATVDARALASTGDYVAIATDYPIYPQSDPFCQQAGEDIPVYLEGFALYDQIVRGAVSYARQHKEALGWDGENIGVIGFSFGATLAMSQILYDTEVQPDAVVGISGFVYPDPQSIPVNTTGADVLKIDFENDTGFVDSFPKPDPKDDCAKLALRGYGCEIVLIPGSGHDVNATDNIEAVSNEESVNVKTSVLDFLQRNLNQ